MTPGQTPPGAKSPRAITALTGGRFERAWSGGHTHGAHERLSIIWLPDSEATAGRPFRGKAIDLCQRGGCWRNRDADSGRMGANQRQAAPPLSATEPPEVHWIALPYQYVCSATAEQVWHRLSAADLAFVAYSTPEHLEFGTEACCFVVLLFLSRATSVFDAGLVAAAVDHRLGGYAADTEQWATWALQAPRSERDHMHAWVRCCGGRRVDADALLSGLSTDADGIDRPPDGDQHHSAQQAGSVEHSEVPA